MPRAMKAAAPLYLLSSLVLVKDDLGVHAAATAASCGSNEDCTGCTESACSTTAGCQDTSPGDYDASYCKWCDDECGDGDGDAGDTLLNVDPDQGCGLGDNIIGSALIGIFAGIFGYFVPCCFACRRSEKDYYNRMIDTSNPSVKRAAGTVTKKWEVASNRPGGGISYWIELNFTIKRPDGRSYVVSGQRLVFDRLYAESAEGSSLEVSYNMSSESEFVIVKDAELRVNSRPQIIMIAVFGIFFVASIGVCALAIVSTGCWIGVIFWLIFVGGGGLCGKFACMRLTVQCGLRGRAEVKASN
eukprot:CAMPEP_0206491564 /NCGR_PEP_ID=MMETSP0324_2-20121206/45145_1 /ASSEMBLY_ACC=CAM_ASM_000836 /TAXON_ID=2866 /ORGANISM="Crypthecodinium cohnii, Strain Seligo" /LENGTH=300 /DNA_ID=CAMNT_0053972927 /DNA_START=70 /DNA_END=972 /DNA_ORIENTATION=+